MQTFNVFEIITQKDGNTKKGYIDKYVATASQNIPINGFPK